MTEIVTPAGTVGYGYNAAGEQTTLTQPEGTVTTSYDLNGFVDTVTDWRGDTITMVNDADGRMIDVARSNGCLLYTSPSPRDATLSRMPSSA